jgi:hypothetical protein
MKIAFFSFALLAAAFSPLSSFAAPDYGLKSYVEKINKSLQNQYKCPVKFTVDIDSVAMKNNLDRDNVVDIIGETEYPIRMACKSDSLKGKITEVSIKCGSEAASGKCTPEQNADGSTSKLSGKTLHIDGKYAHCACGKNAARKSVEEILK